MSSPDRRSPLVYDTYELGRHAGGTKLWQTSVAAPAGLGDEVIGVPPGAPVELDLQLDGVIEGVLISGTASMTATGSCVRCLTAVTEQLEIDVQELFVYPSSEAGEDEASRLEGELLDLEPLLRDEVVLELPFQPLCREDCAGLCAECGVDLNVEPDHTHSPELDSRWARLRDVAEGPQNP